MELISNISIIIFFISIFVLAFFCAVKPNLLMASIFYFVFAISVLYPGIYLSLEEDEPAAIIMVVVFSLAGIFGGFISLAKYKEAKKNNTLDEANKKWGSISRKQGKRRLIKVLKK